LFLSAKILPIQKANVTLKVLKLKGVPFETALIERYRRRESSVEEALIEMYLAGVSVRRVEDMIEALWGNKKYINMKIWRQALRMPLSWDDFIPPEPANLFAQNT